MNIDEFQALQRPQQSKCIDRQNMVIVEMMDNMTLPLGLKILVIHRIDKCNRLDPGKVGSIPD